MAAATSKPCATVTLTVRSARDADVYRDTIRIAEADRGSLKTGTICRFKAGDATAYAILRGLGPARNGEILIDEALRDRLKVPYGQCQQFEIQQVGFLGSLMWGWNATDPTYATAARLGVLSFVLGVIAVALTLPPLIEFLGRWLLSPCNS